MQEKLLRFPTIREVTGLSRTTIWRKERDGTFPRHKKISAQCVGWLNSEIMTWLQNHHSANTVGTPHLSVEQVASVATMGEKNHVGQ